MVKGYGNVRGNAYGAAVLGAALLLGNATPADAFQLAEKQDYKGRIDRKWVNGHLKEGRIPFHPKNASYLVVPEDGDTPEKFIAMQQAYLKRNGVTTIDNDFLEELVVEFNKAKGIDFYQAVKDRTPFYVPCGDTDQADLDLIGILGRKAKEYAAELKYLDGELARIEHENNVNVDEVRITAYDALREAGKLRIDVDYLEQKLDRHDEKLKEHEGRLNGHDREIREIRKKKGLFTDVAYDSTFGFGYQKEKRENGLEGKGYGFAAMVDILGEIEDRRNLVWEFVMKYSDMPSGEWSMGGRKVGEVSLKNGDASIYVHTNSDGIFKKGGGPYFGAGFRSSWMREKEKMDGVSASVSGNNQWVFVDGGWVYYKDNNSISLIGTYGRDSEGNRTIGGSLPIRMGRLAHGDPDVLARDKIAFDYKKTDGNGFESNGEGLIYRHNARNNWGFEARYGDEERTIFNSMGLEADKIKGKRAEIFLRKGGMLSKGGK